MVKKSLLLISCILALISFSSNIPAAEETVHRINCKVKDVDLNENSLVVGGPGGDMVVYLEKHSTVTLGKIEGRLQDIKVGAIVEIRYKIKDGENMAKTILAGP